MPKTLASFHVCRYNIPFDTTGWDLREVRRDTSTLSLLKTLATMTRLHLLAGRADLSLLSTKATGQSMVHA